MARCAVPRSSWIVWLAVVVLAGCGGGSMTPPTPSFTLSASPSNPSVAQGGTATSTITVMGQNGFEGSVSLSATGLPDGVRAAFNPPSTTSTSTLTLTASSAATLGNATVTAVGTSGTLSKTAQVNITVAAPSVTVNLSPQRAAVVATSQTQQFTVTVAGNVSDLSITWSVDGITGGNAASGTIVATGATTALYIPPASAGVHTVSATSVSVPTASSSASVAVTDIAGVFTYHNSLSRDGTNTQEYALSASSVTASTFGKLFSCAVDGAVYTQPLWVPGLTIGGGVHNVIFVATQHDSLYAFDADARPCVKYWNVNLLDAAHSGTAGETPVPWADVGQGFKDIYSEIGVTGTPVIDPATKTIYVVSKSENASTAIFFQRLHALDLATGNEQLNSPQLIAAVVPGTGDGSLLVTFDPRMQHQRSGLALAGGTVYIAWAAHEDATPYHGWLMGYNAANVQQQFGIYNTTPNGGLGGIWSAGGAPAVDSGGFVYVSTGNGIFDANLTTIPNNDFGDSILRFDPTANLVDWFTPDNQAVLSVNDTDLGSGGVVLLPDQSSGLLQHLLVGMGKEGVVYLIDRDNMGHFQASSNSQIVQVFKGASFGMWGTPALWQNNLYFGGAGDTLKHFTFDPSTGLFTKSISSQSAQVFNFPGASPSVSSQGASNGIVWAIDASQYGVPSSFGAGPAVLHAYNAANLAVEYWNSSMAANNRDQAGNAVKFVPPTIANGKVYVSTRTEIDVYGLLPN